MQISSPSSLVTRSSGLRPISRSVWPHLNPAQYRETATGKRKRQCHFQRLVEDRLAGRVLKFCKQQRIFCPAARAGRDPRCTLLANLRFARRRRLFELCLDLQLVTKLLKIDQQVARRVVSLIAFFLKRFLDYPLQFARQVRGELVTGCGSELMIDESVSVIVSPLNGTLPVSIS